MKRFFRGGIHARMYNELVDHLPRQRIQSTPDVFASQTPRGQIIQPKPVRSIYSKPPTYLHPFQIVLRDEWMVYYGTVNGQAAFAYPFFTFTPIGNVTRLVVSWDADFDGMQGTTFGGYGVTNIAVTSEDGSTPFQAETINQTTIALKAIIGFVFTGQEGVGIQQIVKGHLPAYIGG